MFQASPLHLYVHIPFCIHKCAYCDFNSHVRPAPPWDEYRRALLNELTHRAAQPQYSKRRIDTIFFGGGTPSLAPPQLIADILQATAELFDLHKQAEISLEANPGTIESEHFAAFRAAGVNRLSIGVQSFNDDELQWLERIHNSQQAMDAFATARSAGFDNVSLDLMYGLPQQQLSDWLQNLDTAVAMAPEHLSCYQLTVEPHTELALRHQRLPLLLPEDDEALEFLRQTRGRLAEQGYQPYEISNFARPGYYCRHNDGYWLYDDYIGIGAGAAGKWDTVQGGITRYSNNRSPESYIRSALNQGSAANSDETLALKKAAAEAVWLGLRRREGVQLAHFKRRFGQDVNTFFANQLAPWEKSGHLITSPEYLQLSDSGLGMADSIAVSVLTG